MDIDHFKVVNDRHGHPAGDLVLKAVSGTLKKALRTSDVVGRYGGEEFLAVLPETGLEQGAAVVERLRGWVSALKIQLDSGKSVEITVSAGVAQYAFAGDSRDLFLKRADAALYRAKDSGRNRVETEPVSPDGRQPDE
jgi:diguanylate cyclase (GGDEF)-like protein